MRLRHALACLASLVLLGACAGSPDQADDVERYRSDVEPLIERLQKRFNEMLGGAATDRAIARVVRQDLPQWNDLTVEIAEVETDDEEIEEAHELLIEAVQIEARAMMLVLDALQSQDYGDMAAVNRESTRSANLMRDFEDALEKIYE